MEQTSIITTEAYNQHIDKRIVRKLVWLHETSNKKLLHRVVL